MKIRLIAAGLLTMLCIPAILTAQNSFNPEDVIRCATMEVEAQRRAANPEMESMEDFEAWLQEKIENGAAERHAGVVFTVPIVFHVIHDGEDPGVASNISQAQVNSQIDVLNEDFRKMMGTNGHNTHPDGADTEIEFCPALLDPMGNVLSEPGINRVDRNTKGFSAPPYSNTNYINNTIKPNTYWNPDDYFNVWVLDLGGGLLGYAQFPNGSGLQGMGNNNGGATTDGLVIGHKYTGRPPHNPYPGPYNYGRTATHEVGHCLGLRHIWGDGPCGTDDFCADTPESDGSNFGCPTGHTSCSTVDMIENYMDYTNDLCMNIFTEDQKTRMRTVLTNSPRRASLTSSTKCTPPAAPVADFSTLDTVICKGNMVQFNDMSSNGPAAWAWHFGGGTVKDSAFDKNPIVQFDSVGTFTVSLISSNAAGADTIVKQSYVTIIDNNGFSISGLSVANETCVGDADGSIQAAITGGNGPFSYTIDGLNYQTSGLFSGLSSGIYTVTILDSNGCLLDTTVEITSFSSPNMVTSSLQFPTCFDACDGSLGFTIASGGQAPFTFYLDGVQSSGTFNNLCAGLKKVVVEDANGCKDSISLNLSSPSKLLNNSVAQPDNGTGNGVVTINASGGSGPYSYFLNGATASQTNTGLSAGTYITKVVDNKGCEESDTVEVSSNVSLEETLLSEVQAYPNPASENLNLSLPLQLELDQLSLLNVVGEEVKTFNAQSAQLDISTLSPGAYYLRLQAKGFVRTITVIIQ